MKLTIEIELDNAAFEEDMNHELCEILGAVAYRVASGRTEGSCLDSNGNTVGKFEVTEPSNIIAHYRVCGCHGEQHLIYVDEVDE